MHGATVARGHAIIVVVLDLIGILERRLTIFRTRSSVSGLLELPGSACERRINRAV
jgi:hypothetical protein